MGFFLFQLPGTATNFSPTLFAPPLDGVWILYCICIFSLLIYWASLPPPPACLLTRLLVLPPVLSFSIHKPPWLWRWLLHPDKSLPNAPHQLYSLISAAAKQKMCIWWWLKVYHYSVSEVKQGMLTVFLFYFNAVSVYSKVSLSSAALFLLEGCQCNAFS